MNVNGNNLPRSAMGANAQNLSNLQRTDKSGQVGEPQEATVNPDRPEGDTEVNKTVIVNFHDDGYDIKYDGVDNDTVVTLFDGEFHDIDQNKEYHDYYVGLGEGFHPNEE